MSIMVKKRGRPSKADIAAREAAKRPVRTDSEILSDLEVRFSILRKLVWGAVKGSNRAITIVGAPGVGKSYNVLNVLEEAERTQNISYEIVSGTSPSALNLYKLSWRNRRPGSVIVLDDVDKIFNDEDALSILKAMCDTSSVRKITYFKDAVALKEEDIPQAHEFNGSVIFISNLDFQSFVDEGRNKYAQHMEAIMSRSLYLDLRLHGRSELAVHVCNVAKTHRIFDREGLTPQQGDAILSFVGAYRDQLRELSLRTILKAAQMAKSDQDWEQQARILLLKSH